MFKAAKNNTMVSIYEPMELPKEDPQELADELDILNSAKQQARINAPSSSSTSPDHHEIRIHSHVKAKVIQAISSVEQSISAIRDEIDTLSLAKESKDVEEMVAEFQSQLDTDFGPKIRELKQLKNESIIAFDQLNDFKRNHGIKRSADYPNSNILSIALLFFFLLLESVINGTFFAAGSDAGLVGGIMEAIVISLVNIGFGVILGFGILRYKNYNVSWVKFLSLIIFTLLLSLPICFNLLIAHFREALIIDPDNAHFLAVQQFRAGMFNVEDVKSWLLFFMGVMFCIVAIYKGYNFDDAYPRYGKIDRVKNEKEIDLIEAHDEFLDYLEVIHKEYLDNLEDKYDSLVNNEKRVGSLSSAFDQQKRILEGYVEHLSDMIRYLVKLYRDTNENERDDQAPIFFKENIVFELPSEELEIFYVDKRKQVTSQRENLSNSLPKIRQRFLDVKKGIQVKLEEAI